LADGFAALDRQIRRIRELGQLAEESAPAVAAAVKKEVTAQIARGVGPDGKPWKPTKSGEKPLQNAGKALTVRAVGPVVVLRLTGYHARHHLGAVKGGVRRPILPTRRIPDPVTRAIKTVVTRQFRKVMES